MWGVVLRQPRAGDEDVACVLSLASLWEAQLADSSLAELRAEGRSCLQSFREVLCYCRVGGWERKGLRSQWGPPSLATSVQPSLSILGWPLPSQPRPEGLPGTEGFLKQIEKSWENHNSCPPAEGRHHLPHYNSLG